MILVLAGIMSKFRTYGTKGRLLFISTDLLPRWGMPF
jgi:hypothetical protein